MDASVYPESNYASHETSLLSPLAATQPPFDAASDLAAHDLHQQTTTPHNLLVDREGALHRFLMDAANGSVALDISAQSNGDTLISSTGSRSSGSGGSLDYSHRLHVSGISTSDTVCGRELEAMPLRMPTDQGGIGEDFMLAAASMNHDGVQRRQVRDQEIEEWRAEAKAKIFHHYQICRRYWSQWQNARLLIGAYSLCVAQASQYNAANRLRAAYRQWQRQCASKRLSGTRNDMAHQFGKRKLLQRAVRVMLAFSLPKFRVYLQQTQTARHLYHANVQSRALGVWKTATSKAKAVRQLAVLADARYHTHLKEYMLNRWHTLFEQRRQQHKQRTDALQLASTWRTRRCLIVWQQAYEKRKAQSKAHTLACGLRNFHLARRAMVRWLKGVRTFERRAVLMKQAQAFHSTKLKRFAAKLLVGRVEEFTIACTAAHHASNHHDRYQLRWCLSHMVTLVQLRVATRLRGRPELFAASRRLLLLSQTLSHWRSCAQTMAAHRSQAIQHAHLSVQQHALSTMRAVLRHHLASRKATGWYEHLLMTDTFSQWKISHQHILTYKHNLMAGTSFYTARMLHRSLCAWRLATNRRKQRVVAWELASVAHSNSLGLTALRHWQSRLARVQRLYCVLKAHLEVVRRHQLARALTAWRHAHTTHTMLVSSLTCAANHRVALLLWGSVQCWRANLVLKRELFARQLVVKRVLETQRLDRALAMWSRQFYAQRRMLASERHAAACATALRLRRAFLQWKVAVFPAEHTRHLYAERAAAYMLRFKQKCALRTWQRVHQELKALNEKACVAEHHHNHTLLQKCMLGLACNRVFEQRQRSLTNRALVFHTQQQQITAIKVWRTRLVEKQQFQELDRVALSFWARQLQHRSMHQMLDRCKQRDMHRSVTRIAFLWSQQQAVRECFRSALQIYCTQKAQALESREQRIAATCIARWKLFATRRRHYHGQHPQHPQDPCVHHQKVHQPEDEKSLTKHHKSMSSSHFPLVLGRTRAREMQGTLRPLPRLPSFLFDADQEPKYFVCNGQGDDGVGTAQTSARSSARKQVDRLANTTNPTGQGSKNQPQTERHKAKTQLPKPRGLPAFAALS
eukprot:m.286671 g.286671  ORF g.286671 m.286671 type:complete len:1088 (-) comp15782_c1_seq1:491-3754(-)